MIHEHMTDPSVKDALIWVLNDLDSVGKELLILQTKDLKCVNWKLRFTSGPMIFVSWVCTEDLVWEEWLNDCTTENVTVRSNRQQEQRLPQVKFTYLVGSLLPWLPPQQCSRPTCGAPGTSL